MTMRTPGQDMELAAGFLVSEGVVRHQEDIWKIEHCTNSENSGEDNVVDVFLAPRVEFDIAHLSRNIVTSSACGICGRSSIESVQQICTDRPRGGFQLSPERISRLPGLLEDAQGVFGYTGGIHAAALVSPTGDLLDVREDSLRPCDQFFVETALGKVVSVRIDKRSP